jgi:transposase-like protein
MKEKGSRYDGALKKEIAQVYLEGSRSAPSLAGELGVHVNTKGVSSKTGWFFINGMIY